MRKFCVMMILLSFVLALFAPLISSYDPNLVDLSKAKIAPNLSHIFGTDLLGRDVFTRILYALRVSLFVGIMAAFLVCFLLVFMCF